MCVNCGTESSCGCNTSVCKNPITYLLDLVQSFNIGNTGAITGLSTTLGGGLLLRNANNYCCPDCGTKKGFYFLGSIDKLKTITDALNMSGVNKDSKYPCCINTNLSGGDPIDVWTMNFKGDNIPCCTATGFDEAVLDLSVLLQESIGIVEASTFNGVSGLAVINLFFKNTTLTEEQKIGFLNYITTNGLVVKCIGCDLYMYTAGGFVLELSNLNII